jgi:hypothetical protein
MRVTVSIDAFTKKLEERGYSPTEIATALEVIKEMEIPLEAAR